MQESCQSGGSAQALDPAPVATVSRGGNARSLRSLPK